MEAYAGQPADVSSSAAQLYADSQADGAGAVEALQVGSPIPDFTADSSAGEIEFYVEIDGGWSLFVTFHKTFDAVATTEVAALAKLADEFADRGVKVIANVCNTKTNNDKWAKECAEMGDCQITFPIVADPMAEIAKSFGLVYHGAAVPIRNLLPATLVVIADPSRTMRFIQQYPATTGRNFEEIVRMVDALQLTTDTPLATGVNWMVGEDVFIDSSVGADDAKALFPKGFVEIKPWFRITAPPDPPQPASSSALAA